MTFFCHLSFLTNTHKKRRPENECKKWTIYSPTTRKGGLKWNRKQSLFLFIHRTSRLWEQLRIGCNMDSTTMHQANDVPIKITIIVLFIISHFYNFALVAVNFVAGFLLLVALPLFFVFLYVFFVRLSFCSIPWNLCTSVFGYHIKYSLSRNAV